MKGIGVAFLRDEDNKLRKYEMNSMKINIQFPHFLEIFLTFILKITHDLKRIIPKSDKIITLQLNIEH